MTQDSEMSEDLIKLRDNIYHPSLRIVSPFLPFVVFPSEPFSFIVLILPLIDFFSVPGKLSRKYIDGYEKWYLMIFLTCTMCRIVLEFMPVVFWIAPILLVPFVAVPWAKYTWTTWWDLYNSAQR